MFGTRQTRFPYLLEGVAGPHPVVHDHAVVGGAVRVVLFVPLRADLVQVFLLIRKHHLVNRLRKWKNKNKNKKTFIIIIKTLFKKQKTQM